MQLAVPPLMLSVALVIFMHRGQKLGTATGMFYQHDGKRFLVTAKHILEGMNGACAVADQLKVIAHVDQSNLNKTTELFLSLYSADASPLWKRGENTDLALVPIAEADSQSLVQTWIDEDNYLPNDVVLMPGELTIAIGFPKGVGDNINCLPLCYTGGVSSSFGIHYQGKPIFYVNIDLASGMSGCPIFTQSQSVSVFQNVNIVLLDKGPYFLGIHSSSGGTIADPRSLQLSSVTYASELKSLASQ
jgi:hypothetical protein